MNKKGYLAIALACCVLSSHPVKALSAEKVASLTALGSTVGALVAGCKDKLDQGSYESFNWPWAVGGGVVTGLISYWIAYKYTRAYHFEQAKEMMHLYLGEKELYDAAETLYKNEENQSAYESFYQTVHLLYPRSSYPLVSNFLDYKTLKGRFRKAISLFSKSKSLEPDTLGYSNKKFKHECDGYITTLRCKIYVIEKAIEALTNHPDFQRQFYLYECYRLDRIEAQANQVPIYIVQYTN